MQQPTQSGIQQADIVMVGAGLVGALGALLLAQSGYRVVVVERGGPQAGVAALKTGGQDLNQIPLRHVAISPSSMQALAAVDAWPMPDMGVFSAMQVWEEQGTARLELVAEQVQRQELGWVCQHESLLQQLRDRLAAHPNIDLHYHAAVTQLAPTAADSRDKRWRLHWVEQQPEQDSNAATTSLDTSLVVAADGANSTIRSLLRTPVSRQDTGHRALVGVVRFEQEHNNVARQRFLLAGPLALLPSGWPDLVSIVWSQPPADAQARQQLEAAEFCQALTLASDRCLGAALEVGPRASFPVQQQLAETFQPSSGVLLLGDAAHVIHPLAGQGVNAGFEDMVLLQRQLGAAAKTSTPIFVPDLGSFAARRRARAQTMARTMAALQAIYAQSNPLFNWVRNAGVRLVQSSALGQRLLIEQALGLSD